MKVNELGVAIIVITYFTAIVGAEIKEKEKKEADDRTPEIVFKKEIE